ncbi:Uncharacterized protein TCM_035896 [Theobroma cacao]|uniref:Uncharacterized protein n=1 Tax=Theobroma cacao TaxID=3641 RepID=A0A061FJP8_THECC|nr:Uncharacterized protein TCM_035896 [Theobroma cacao]
MDFSHFFLIGSCPFFLYWTMSNFPCLLGHAHFPCYFLFFSFLFFLSFSPTVQQPCCLPFSSLHMHKPSTLFLSLPPPPITLPSFLSLNFSAATAAYFGSKISSYVPLFLLKYSATKLHLSFKKFAAKTTTINHQNSTSNIKFSATKFCTF